MRIARLLLPGGILIAAVTLAFFLRDLAYQLIVIPLAYALWLGGIYYSAVPQFLLWALLILFIFMGVTWRLIPEAARPLERRPERSSRRGPVEALTIHLLRGRASTYFRWQVANRLARLARRASEGLIRPGDSQMRAESLHRYLAAGLNQSFVDFPTPRGLLRRPSPTPLDLDPNEVVEYLESRMELNRDRRPRGI